MKTNWRYAAIAGGVLLAFGLINLAAHRTPTTVISQTVFTGQSALAAPMKPVDAGEASAKAQLAMNEEPDADTQIQQEMLRIADAYEVTSRYPTYSFPIDAKSVHHYQYNKNMPTRLPLEIDGEPGALSLSTEKTYYLVGEEVLVVAALTGSALSGSISSVVLTDLDGKTTLATANMNNTVEGTYEGRIPLNASASWPDSTLLKVTASIKGKNLSASSEIRINPATASLAAMASPAADGEHLILPATFEVDREGYYMVEANLYQEDGSAFAHVIAEGNLSQLANTLNFRVHGTVLPAGIRSVVMTDVSVRRLPDMPGDVTQYGQASPLPVSIDISGVAPIKAQAYRDVEAQERIQFLRQ